jgi:hypothetical protein
MNRIVVLPTAQQKITGVIISFIAIDVMDDFPRFKPPAYGFLGNITMYKYVAIIKP